MLKLVTTTHIDGAKAIAACAVVALIVGAGSVYNVWLPEKWSATDLRVALDPLTAQDTKTDLGLSSPLGMPQTEPDRLELQDKALGQSGNAIVGRDQRVAPDSPTAQDTKSNPDISFNVNVAEGGDPIAQWKLGRMYASGDGVAQDDVRAFEYFSKIANAHAKDSPSAPQASIIANALVALGRYYLNGIPNSKVKPDTERAREMFFHAASYFGNADAQYDLARLYLKTPDASREDLRYGARWLGLAAHKGQYQAQALLGQMLFNGDRLPPQRARGLMWLTLARDATADEIWIKESYDRAMAKASEDDRAMALQMLENAFQRPAQARRTAAVAKLTSISMRPLSLFPDIDTDLVSSRDIHCERTRSSRNVVARLPRLFAIVVSKSAPSA